MRALFPSLMKSVQIAVIATTVSLVTVGDAAAKNCKRVNGLYTNNFSKNFDNDKGWGCGTGSAYGPACAVLSDMQTCCDGVSPGEGGTAAQQQCVRDICGAPANAGYFSGVVSGLPDRTANKFPLNVNGCN